VVTLRVGTPAAYLITVGAVGLATLLRTALSPLVGTSAPFVTYFLAALWVAWSYGFWPAEFAIVLAAFIGGHFILAAGAGTLLPVATADRAAMMAFGIVATVVAFLIDLQHRTLQRAQSAEGEQRRANAELARVNRDLESFAFSASHDLQEPMRTISLSVDYLEGSLRGKLEGNDARFLAHLRNSALRMSALLDGLLLYAKLNDFELAPCSTESRRVLDDVQESLSIAIKAAGAKISVGDGPAVAVHEIHLAQIFQNLLGNAVKYGGKRIDVTAGRQEDGFWIFSVADDGMGISMEYAEQIFGLFKRLDADHHGNGVGLAICRRIVERYGGRIWLHESELGRGSAFRFTVPPASGQTIDFRSQTTLRQ
jgi:signal transduction histidine kinase